MSLCLCHCSQGHVEIVKFLVTNSKSDVNAKDSRYGMTPLHWACQYTVKNAVFHNTPGEPHVHGY